MYITTSLTIHLLIFSNVINLNKFKDNLHNKNKKQKNLK